MATQVSNMVIPMRAQLNMSTFLKKGIWLFVVIISIPYSIVGFMIDLGMLDAQSGFLDQLSVYLNFLSFVLGVTAGAIIFFRKPSSWLALMTSLMLVTFTATDTGFRFWFVVLEGVWDDTVLYPLSLFVDVLYMGLLTSSLAYVLLSFPEGKFIFRSSRWFFGFLIGSQVLAILFIGLLCLLDILFPEGGYIASFMYDILDRVKAVVLLLLAPWPILRLRRITDPVQRQQIKWIAWNLTGTAIAYSSYTLYMLRSNYNPLISTWIFFVLLVFTYAFIITLLIAMMRYRLWDMSFIASKAIMYSLMTAVLGGFGFLGATLLEILTAKSDSSLMTVTGLVVVSAVFHPVKDRMQAIVDRHFKPEEVDFSSAMVEITPEAQLMLTSGEILKILVKQSVEQMDLSGASIYLRWADGQMVQSEPAARNPLAAQLKLDDKTLTLLEKGSVVVPPEGSPSSLYIPLVLTRAARPDFLGVLVLGPRNSGEGYPTVLVNSLRKLGCDAGKAIYLAQLRERLGQNGTDRRVALERGLLFRQKPLDA